MTTAITATPERGQSAASAGARRACTLALAQTDHPGRQPGQDQQCQGERSPTRGLVRASPRKALSSRPVPPPGPMAATAAKATTVAIA